MSVKVRARVRVRVKVRVRFTVRVRVRVKVKVRVRVRLGLGLGLGLGLILNIPLLGGDNRKEPRGLLPHRLRFKILRMCFIFAFFSQIRGKKST